MAISFQFIIIFLWVYSVVKKDDTNSLTENLRTQNSMLKEELSLMVSIKDTNEILKKQVQEACDLKRDEEYLIKHMCTR